MKKKAQLNYERHFVDLAIGRLNAHAERVAGSGSKKTGVCDVVVIINSQPFLCEIKATRYDRFCFCGEQRNVLLKAASGCGATPLLAVRFKRRKWCIVNLLERDKRTVHVSERGLWEDEINDARR
jgi:Holliday junction resolvase